MISHSSNFTVVSCSESRTNLIGSRPHRCRSYLTGSTIMVPWSNTSVPRKLHPDRFNCFYRVPVHPSQRPLLRLRFLVLMTDTWRIKHCVIIIISVRIGHISQTCCMLLPHTGYRSTGRQTDGHRTVTYRRLPLKEASVNN